MEDLIKTVTVLTAYNNHTQARLVIADFINNKRLVDLYYAIREIQNIEGYLPNPLSKYRYSLDKELKKAGLKQIGKDFNKIWEVM